ncbi:MAG: hypothetical protein ACK4IX_00170 [Candidatus Sericytochromatia bacterium]
MSEINQTSFIPTTTLQPSNSNNIKSETTKTETNDNPSNLSIKDDISNIGKSLPKGISATNISLVDEDRTKEKNINTNEDISEKSFNEFSSSLLKFVEDGTLDKSEYNKLKEIVNSAERKPNKLSVKYNEEIINLHMSKLESKIEQNKTSVIGDAIFDPQKKVIKKTIFEFTPTYSENEKIAGETPFEIVSNISQNDSLTETKTDGSRCAPSSLLNAYLLMGGKFEDLAKKFEIDPELTHKNVHLMQDKLYSIGNTNNKGGFSAGTPSALQNEFDKTDKILGKKTPPKKGELEILAKKMGFEVKEIVGLTEKVDSKGFKLTDITKSVDKFFKDNPNGTLSIGVILEDSSKNTEPSIFTGKNNVKLNKPEVLSANHSVLVFKENDDFYLADTGGLTNGNKSSITKMTPKDVNDLVYTNRSNVFALTLKNNPK